MLSIFINKTFLLFVTLVTLTSGSPLIDLLNPINKSIWKLFEEPSVSPSELNFYYYSQLNKDNAVVINLGNFSGHIDDFNPFLPTYFFAHGSGDRYTSTITFKNSILDKRNANVFLLDYRKQAALFYTQAVTSIRQVGPLMGEAIQKICDHHGLLSSNINLIGHSLGAHVIGAIGAFLQGNANYIIGLDPAGPLFTNQTADRRLDVTDAQFVQVIHTNGGFQGISEPIGHADYFPNGGGMSQVGCGADLIGSCAHARATAFYKESLETGRFCARSCASYDDFRRGRCAGNAKSYFGEIDIDKDARGNYYFDTNSKSPFATGKC